MIAVNPDARGIDSTRHGWRRAGPLDVREQDGAGGGHEVPGLHARAMWRNLPGGRYPRTRLRRQGLCSMYSSFFFIVYHPLGPEIRSLRNRRSGRLNNWVLCITQDAFPFMFYWWLNNIMHIYIYIHLLCFMFSENICV